MPRYTLDGKEYLLSEENLTEDEVREKVNNILTGRSSEQTGTGTYEDPKYEGFFTEAGEGVFSGVLGIFQGIGELGALGVDLIADTSYAEEVEKGFNDFRNKLGIDPAGLAGKLTEGVVQFGIPGLGAAGAISKFSKLGKLAKASKPGKLDVARKGLGGKTVAPISRNQKFGLAVSQVSAAGVADFVVSTDNTQTIGDFFEGGITQTEKRIGAGGREDAVRRLQNKLRVGAEGAVATTIIPPILGAATKGVAKAGAARVPGTSTTVADVATLGAVPATRKLISGAKTLIKRQEDAIKAGEVGKMSEAVGKTLSLFRFRGFSDPEVADIKSLINPGVEARIKRGQVTLNKIDKKISSILKDRRIKGKDAQRYKEKYINNFMDVLEGSIKKENGILKSKVFDENIINKNKDGKIISKGRFIFKEQNQADKLPDELFNVFKEAKDQIDDLSKQLLKADILKEMPDLPPVIGKDGIERIPLRDPKSKQLTVYGFKQMVLNNIENGGYLNRQYNIFNDANFKLSDEAVNNIVSNMTAGKSAKRYGDFQHIKYMLDNQADDTLKISDTELASLKKGDSTLRREQLLKYIEEVDDAMKRTMRSKGFTKTSRIAEVRMNPALLQKRKLDNQLLRDIYGEVRNPREAFISTMSELSTFIGSDKFYSRFKQIADEDILKKGNKSLYVNTQQILKDYVDVNQKSLAAADRRLKEGEKFTLDMLEESDIQKIIGNELARRKKEGYKILGRNGNDGSFKGQATTSPYGQMFGYAVPEVVWNSMTSKAYGDGDTFGNLLKMIYTPMLKIKGVTQYTKTILSPITQIRNITSAAGFAFMQGNVGKDSSLGTSIGLVYRDILKNGTDYTQDFLADLQKRGVIGSSAQLREIQDQLRKGVGYEREAFYEAQRKAVDEVGDVGQTFAQQESKLKKFVTKPFKPLGAFGRRMEDLYRGGDDVWKIYNYVFELQKLKNARLKSFNAGKQDNFLKHIGVERDADGKIKNGMTLDEAMKTHAANVVRNTVPNYELVPELIKGIRGLPLGNFIAFPAEILRTGFNTLDVALKELASDDATIREIGMRRLMGSAITVGTLGPALQSFSQSMTGTTDDELDAIRRLAPEWQRNSTIIPIGKDENGNIEYIDFSRTHPYDYLTRGINAFFNELDETGKLSKDGYSKVGNAVMESISEYFSPFLDPSISFEAALDIAPSFVLGGRGGETRQGATIYKEGETIGKKVEKSIVHMLRTITPGMVPIDIPIGSEFSFEGLDPSSAKPIKLSRFARGLSFGAEKDPLTGKTFEASGEIFRGFTGLQSETIDLEKQLKFKSFEFKQARSEASSIFNQIRNLENPSMNQILSSWVSADEARLRAFRRYYLHVEDLKTLGMEENEIRKLMRKEYKLGRKETNSILNDEYIPLEPSKETIRLIRKKDIDFPFEEIQDLRDQRENIPLSKFELPEIQRPDKTSELFSTPKKAPVVSTTPTTKVTAAPVNTQLQNNQQTNTAFLNPVFQPSTNTQVASLLGGSPEDILKNLQIAERNPRV